MRGICFRIFILGLLYVGGITSVKAQKMDICNVYGSVYITKDARQADFVVYEEESEAFADLVIFLEDNKLYADEKGIWFFAKAMDFADFVIYKTDDKDLADFSIHYIDTRAFAGCKKD